MHPYTIRLKDREITEFRHYKWTHFDLKLISLQDANRALKIDLLHYQEKEKHCMAFIENLQNSVSNAHAQLIN